MVNLEAEEAELTPLLILIQGQTCSSRHIDALAFHSISLSVPTNDFCKLPREWEHALMENLLEDVLYQWRY